MNNKFIRKPITVLRIPGARPDGTIGVQNQGDRPETRAKLWFGAAPVFASKALSVLELQLMCDLHLNLLDTGRLY